MGLVAVCLKISNIGHVLFGCLLKGLILIYLVHGVEVLEEAYLVHSRVGLDELRGLLRLELIQHGL